jgi:hypothetical protein
VTQLLLHQQMQQTPHVTIPPDHHCSPQLISMTQQQKCTTKRTDSRTEKMGQSEAHGNLMATP